MRSGKPRERLAAARYLAKAALPDDEQAILEARRDEPVPWIRDALDQAIARTARAAGAAGAPRTRREGPTDDGLTQRDATASAFQEISGRIVHELAPLIGATRFHARREIEEFAASRTNQSLERLVELLRAIELLGVAAASAANKEFDLSALIREEVDHLQSDATSGASTAEIPGPTHDQTVQPEDVELQGIRIEPAHRVPPAGLVGPTPFVIFSDPALVRIAIRNGLRNAYDAALSLPGRAVTIAWDETDRDYWIAILDRGVGLPPNPEKVFEIGATTKAGHLGMGLALAKRAADTLEGTIDLTPNEEGTKFELRWPRTAQSQ